MIKKILEKWFLVIKKNKQVRVTIVWTNKKKISENYLIFLKKVIQEIKLI